MRSLHAEPRPVQYGASSTVAHPDRPCRLLRPSPAPHRIEPLEGRLLLTVTYSFKELGVLPGGQNGFALGVNNAGQVVGYDVPPSGKPRAWLYSNGALTALGTLPGDDTSGANGINDAGLVVGYSEGPHPTEPGNTLNHAVSFSGGGVRDLGASGSSYAAAINQAGQIVGKDFDGTNGGAILIDQGQIRELGTLPGGDSAFANAINNLGQVAGVSNTADPAVFHAFFSGGGAPFDLGTLGGDVASDANGLNDLGQVVGWSSPTTASPNTSDLPEGSHAFVSSGGTMVGLGVLPGDTTANALGIDAGGQVVGYSTIGLDYGSAFVYVGGQMLNLNGLIPRHTGFHLARATAINALGQIVGSAVDENTGDIRPFLLTPVANADPVSAADPTFGQGGSSPVPFAARAVKATPDGGAVVAGSAAAPGGYGLFTLARYAAGGSLASSASADFGTDARATGVALAPDGRALVVGTVTVGSTPHLALARFTAAGAPDRAFGRRGKWLGPAVVPAGGTLAFAVAQQADGKILVADDLGTTFSVTRYNADLSLDTSFGGGRVITSFGSGLFPASASALAVGPDGKVVVAGLVAVTGAGGTANRLGVARFNPDGSPDATFAGGQVLTDVNRLNAVSDLLVARDGTVTALGYATARHTGPLPVEARYRADGTLDATFGTGGIFQGSFLPAGAAGAIGGATPAANNFTLLALAFDGRFLEGSATVLRRLAGLPALPALDTNAPRAVLAPLNSPALGARRFSFTLTYHDDRKVDTSTINGGNVYLRGPGRQTRGAAVAAVAVSRRRDTVTVSYTVAAPGGHWDAADNGSYGVFLRSDTVADTSANYVRGGRLATFQVAFAAPGAARQPAATPRDPVTPPPAVAAPRFSSVLIPGFFDDAGTGTAGAASLFGTTG